MEQEQGASRWWPTIGVMLGALTVSLNIGVLIAGVFVASLTCLSLSFLMFLIEVRIATRSLRIGGKIRR